MKVMCVPIDKLPQKICSQTGAFKIPLDELINPDDIIWIERSQAETNFQNKHLITYVLFENGKGEFACYPRHGSEKRLHGLYSFGIGGHIDIVDDAGDFLSTVENALFRELNEELLNFNKEKLVLHYLGAVSEKESEVGLVHLGLVYLAKCKENYIPIAAEETKGLEWKSRIEIQNVKKELWSSLAFQFL